MELTSCMSLRPHAGVPCDSSKEKNSEEARDHVKALRAQETTMEKCCSEYEDLSSNLEVSVFLLKCDVP